MLGEKMIFCLERGAVLNGFRYGVMLSTSSG